MPLQRGVAIGYDADVKRYGEALRRLEKAKKELSPIHAELLEMLVYDIVAVFAVSMVFLGIEITGIYKM